MITIQYIAGFVDGEGNISIRRANASGKYKNPRYDPVLYITNTNKFVLEEIKDFLGGGYVFAKKQIQPNWKIGYVYQWAGCKIIPILERLSNHLIVKKPLADKICRYKNFFGFGSYKKGNQYTGINSIPQDILQKREEIYNWCKKFNHKGI